MPAGQVVLAAAKRGRLSKSIASASAKSVSSLNAIISRTSKAVKVGAPHFQPSGVLFH
jgi:hypothetical protein